MKIIRAPAVQSTALVKNDIGTQEVQPTIEGPLSSGKSRSDPIRCVIYLAAK